MSGMFSQLRELWSRLSMAQRVLAGGLTALVLGAIVIGTLYGTGVEYRLLAAELDRSDANKLVAKLESAGIPFRLLAGGSEVEVDASRIDEAAAVALKADIDIGGDGLQKGYRMLENGEFWKDTRDQYKMRVLIAREQELANTIRDFDGVERAKLHITPPRRSFSKSESRPAKASVVVHLRPGRLLSPNQVESIVQLVAHAVQGLEPEGVVVSDGRGMVLTRTDGLARAAQVQIQAQREREQQLQENVQSALDQALGKGKSIVRVHVELDPEQVQETESVPDSEGRVTTHEHIKSSSGTRGAPGGAVSARAIQDGTAGSAGAGSKTEEAETSYSYPIKKSTRVKDAGSIARRTVGVMVDEEFQAKQAELLALVKTSVGFKEGRDAVSVSFLPISIASGEGAEVAVAAEAVPAESPLSWVFIALPAVGAVGLLFLMLRSAGKARKEIAVFLTTPTPEEEALIERRRREAEQGTDPGEDIVRMVEKSPEAVGKLLRSWIYEPVGS